MRIPATATISACENALLTLSKLSSPCGLQIPTKLKYLVAGGELSWIQLLLTYSQMFPERSSLQTYAKTGKDIQIDNFCRRLYGLVASLVVSKITTRDRLTDLTAAYRSHAYERLKDLQSDRPYEATRGPSVDIVAVDHLSRGSPTSLYRRNYAGLPELRSRTEFIDLANYLVAQTDRYNKVPNRPDVIKALGNILFETFKNTDDHALTDIYGNRLPVSVRLLQASILTPTKDILETVTTDYAPFSKYFSFWQDYSKLRQIPFLMLSILDSGPGFAQRWTRTPTAQLSLTEELDAVRECFTHGTSKGHSRFGQGLPLVYSLLKRYNGFLRLRTGRLSLYYDSRRVNADEHGRINLESWQPANTRLAPAAGALLTMLLPIGSNL